jgi:hypothetical protein
MSEQDAVVLQATSEVQKAWRAAVQVGEFLARRRQRALSAAEDHSRGAAHAIRSVIEEERRQAEPIYKKALEAHWWETTSAVDAATVYGAAKRFATLDPQAALAARTCEKEAEERWGIDLTAPATSDNTPTQDDALRVLPDLVEGDAVAARTQIDQALADAATTAAKEHVEADEALTAATGQHTPQASAEVDDETRADAAWDTLEARKAWEDQMEGATHDHAAVRAAVTADKGISQPPSQALRTVKTPTTVKKPRSAQAAARTRTSSL